ncbi:MAG: 2'-5' RNA ligase family protein [Chloroflexi bacterium]|nr:2'-5' RNA ligase family protein [Chloroflexota bacterium]
MQGIVSLLDDPYAQIVHAIWDELKTKCGIVGTQVPRFPHFSYHVAERYDDDALKRALHTLTSSQKVFKVKTAGLGIFTTPDPVVFVNVVCDSTLAALHESIYAAVHSVSHNAVTYYQPHHWFPHITLAQSDLTRDTLPDVIPTLINAQNFEWEISVNNITWLSETNVIARYNF